MITMVKRHGNPVRGGETSRRAEADDDRERADHQRPIDLGHIDLAHLVGGGVIDAQARAVAKLHCLPGQGEGAGDQGLRGDDRCRGREHDQRQRRPAWRQHEERLGGGAAVREQERPLAEVVDEQRGEHEREPRESDRALAEVAHVGIQRLAAGHHEKDRTKHGEAVPAVVGEEPDSVARIDRREHGGVRGDPPQPENGEDDEPHHHHRSEKGADPMRAVPLDRKDADEDADSDRDDIVLEHAASTTFRPSTALSTVIAGVMMPSP